MAPAGELETLHERFSEAMAVLKQADIKGQLGGAYVYQLPWYLIIDLPGCSKTRPWPIRPALLLTERAGQGTPSATSWSRGQPSRSDVADGYRAAPLGPHYQATGPGDALELRTRLRSLYQSDFDIKVA